MGNQNARIQNVLEENVVLLVVLAIIINLVIKNLRHAVVLIVHEVNVVVINRDVLRCPAIGRGDDDYQKRTMSWWKGWNTML